MPNAEVLGGGASGGAEVRRAELHDGNQSPDGKGLRGPWPHPPWGDSRRGLGGRRALTQPHGHPDSDFQPPEP